jgi:beta-xylosidase
LIRYFDSTDIPAAIAAAKEADVVILYVGGKAGWYVATTAPRRKVATPANIELPP